MYRERAWGQKVATSLQVLLPMVPVSFPSLRLHSGNIRKSLVSESGVLQPWVWTLVEFKSPQVSPMFSLLFWRMTLTGNVGWEC